MYLWTKHVIVTTCGSKGDLYIRVSIDNNVQYKFEQSMMILEIEKSSLTDQKNYMYLGNMLRLLKFYSYTM